MFLRDTNSKGLVNTDIVTFNKYKKEKERTREIETLKTRIQNLEDLYKELAKSMGIQ